LELLKDIAGTSVYEEKRKESTALMQETGNIKKDLQEEESTMVDGKE
jgi:hypothetical protein